MDRRGGVNSARSVIDDDEAGLPSRLLSSASEDRYERGSTASNRPKEPPGAQIFGEDPAARRRLASLGLRRHGLGIVESRGQPAGFVAVQG